MKTHERFRDAINRVGRDLALYAYSVDGKRWQSTDVSDKPDMRMREIFNTSFQVSLSSGDYHDYQSDIGPNLPWADDHFDERVGGEPLNPGVQWAKWPFSLSADKFRTEGDGPLLPPEHWAYVAGFFDGDGTIHFHTQKGREHKPPHIRLQIGQKERTVLDHVQELLRIGTVVQKKTAQKKILNGKEYEQRLWRWAAGSHSEVLWALKGMIPYLIVKSKKALEAIEHLEDHPPSTQGSPRKGVWDREWETRFSHSYMQRYWPRFDTGEKPRGLMYRYGDLSDVVQHLADHPETRQAYLPVWFPEDTGVVHGERVPCTLGYHFIVRMGYLHCTYYIRSCDFGRHFRDDLYLSTRLQLWILEQLRKRDATWENVQPGMFIFHCVSMHCFENDYKSICEDYM